MPITAVISNSDGVIHGTDNGKKTGCGIKYNTGDNLRKYKQGEVLTDLIMAMKTLNCEKCRRVLSTKMIKEDRKAENKREKEEQKRIAEAIKRGELDADGNPIVVEGEGQEELSTQEVVTDTPIQEVDEDVETIPTPAPAPVQVQAPVETASVEQPPIVEDLTDTIDTPVTHVEEYQAPTPQVDDDIAQFMVNPTETSVEEPAPAPAKKKPLEDINDILADLDALMSNISTKETSTVNKVTSTRETAHVVEDVTPVVAPPVVEEVSVPVVEDVAPKVAPPVVEEVSVPVVEDIAPKVAPPVVEEVSVPVVEDVAPKVAPPVVEEVSVPVVEDVAPVVVPPVVEEVSVPVVEDIAPKVAPPVVEEVSVPVVEDVAPKVAPPMVEEVSVPVVEDVAPKVAPPVVEEVSTPPVVETPVVSSVAVPPVVSSVPQNQGFAQPTFNGYQAQPQPTPVVPQPQPTYVQPTPMPQFYYNAYGEAIPITYNAQNQPVFTVPVTYDAQGQPRPMQVTPQPIPQPYAPQPTYVQPTPVAPTPTVSTPPPTRVVRADAPPLISKPSENKPFDFSVFEKESEKPVFVSSENKIFVDSIEEALSQLGVETEESEEESNDVTPEFQEYVAPTKTTAKPKSTPKAAEPKQELSEAERKKREKMDAKLRKEWEKKGLDPNAWKRMRH